MTNKASKKQRNFSIKLKTCFAIQSHIDEFNQLIALAKESGVSDEECEALCEIMENAIAESLKTVFPKPFEA